MLIINSTDYSKRVTNNLITKLGRFSWFRSIRRKIQTPTAAYNVRFNNILSNNVDVHSCIKQINDTALYQGFYLQKHLVDEILNFAIANECIEPNTNKVFYALSFTNLPNSNYIYRGLVTNTQKCQAIDEVKFNHKLIEIATQFLGYKPRKITQHLTWSFVVPESEQLIQQKYPASRWHYDVVGEESITFNFYLTDVNNDREGCHQFMPCSHKNKPWQLFFKSSSLNEDILDKYFPQKPKLPVFGSAGYGFIENPLCWHRVKPPTANPRLILQIRYS